jgi:enoyl-CoA hydratase
MPSDSVLLDISQYIAVVTLNRPPANPLDRTTRLRLTSIFDELSDRDDVRAAVLTGSGHIFCAGSDLKDRPNSDRAGDYGQHNRIVREAANSITECTKPVIAAVNGAALGAGLALVAACDIMVASEDAVFGMPEINVGLAGGAAMLQELFGRSRMRRMMFTGERFPASELYRLGVIEACVPPSELIPEAMRMASDIATKDPRGIKYAKLSANISLVMPQRDAYRLEQGFTVELSKRINSQGDSLDFAAKSK